MAGLAVSDIFTVESFYENKKYSYAISMQNGIPVTMHMGDEDTEEPNGLKLSVAVPLKNISNYVYRAPKLYQYFDYKPNLNLDINVEENTNNAISDYWYMNGTYTSYVVMSQVAYAIPNSDEIDTKGFRGVTIKVPPGSVTFNPGRESLSLNKSTVDYLNNLFSKIADECVENAINAYAAAKNDYEVFSIYQNTVFSLPYDLRSKANPTIFLSQEAKNLFSVTYSGKTDFGRVQQGDLFNNATNNHILLQYKSFYNKTASNLSYAISQSDFYQAAHIIVDFKTGFKKPLYSYYTNKGLVLWQKTKNTDIETFIKTAKSYLSALGLPYKLASEVISKPEVKSTKRAKFYCSKIYKNRVERSEELGLDDCKKFTYLYIKTENNTPIVKDSSILFEDYMAAYDALKHITHMPKLRAVSKKYQKTTDALDNWVDYETFIKEKLKTVTFIDGTINDMFLTRLHSIETYRDNFPEPIKNFIDLYKSIKKQKTQYNYIASSYIMDSLKKFKANVSNISCEDNLNDLRKDYPCTVELMTTYHNLTPSFVQKIAKLEETNAIYSNK